MCSLQNKTVESKFANIVWKRERILDHFEIIHPRILAVIYMVVENFVSGFQTTVLFFLTLSMLQIWLWDCHIWEIPTFSSKQKNISKKIAFPKDRSHHDTKKNALNKKKTKSLRPFEPLPTPNTNIKLCYFSWFCRSKDMCILWF
jgi:hypothetical protein